MENNIDMKPFPRPHLPVEAEWSDLGDMSEIIQFRTEYGGFTIRWDCIVNGNHKTINPKTIFKDKADIELGDTRSKVREAFKKEAIDANITD